MKNSIWNRNRELPTCSAVPQATAPPRAPPQGLVGGEYGKWPISWTGPQVRPEAFSSGAHPASHLMGKRGFFLQVKAPGDVKLTTHCTQF